VHQDDAEYKLFIQIWQEQHRVPRPREYRALAKRTSYPSIEELTEKYGSFDNAVSSFLHLYHAIHGYREIPDYLLGALVGRAKVVRENNRRIYLRYTSDDVAQIDILRSFMRDSTVHRASQKQSTLYLRCYDDELTLAFEHECRDGLPFRPTVDFVRGYIDTHSHFRATTPQRHRLTITGPLVPQCHDFLVQLGAENTQISRVGNSYRMNVHSRSLQKIRDALYPDGCVCNERVRRMMYEA
jgi:hypothetical protein